MNTHRDVMVARAHGEGWRRGAELGIGSGLLFEKLLSECPDLFLIGVDAFFRTARRERVYEVAEKFPGRCRLIWDFTVAAAIEVRDRSLDFVFIDAGHSYGAVLADIDAWWPKVKPGGWFGGHDYHENHPGVIRAVDEVFKTPGPGARPIVLDPHAVWWVRR